MRRTIWSLIMISCTMAFTLIALAGTQDDVIPARIVQVQRDNVHQTISLSGTLTFAEQKYAFSTVNGVVSQICTEENERIAAGEAIVRVDSLEREAVMTAYATGEEYLKALENQFGDAVLLSGSSVVRAEKACTVRQILVEEGSTVSVGTPVVRLSSNEQEIVCRVNKVDASLLSEGMWAWLYEEEAELGYAFIQSIDHDGADPLTGIPVFEVILRPEKSVECPEGTALEIEVYLAGSDDAATLPLEAITERGTVWWVDDGGKCTEISAGLIMYDEMLAWVSLPEGIRVAVGEFEEGQRVREAEK